VTLANICGTNSHNRRAKGQPGVGVVKIFCDSDSDSSGLKSFRLLDSDSTALDSFMSDVSELYKSCAAHLAKWTSLFAEFKCFD